MALPRRERLSKQKDFLRVYRRSRVARGSLLSVRLHKKNTPPGRVAVVVSNKVSKRAVERNRIRRRILEWLRVRARIGAQPIDIIVAVQPPTKQVSREALIKELEHLSRTLRII